MSAEASDPNASLDVEANATGVKLGAKGGGAARLSEALADLISPFSAGMGFLGDRFGDLRRAAAFRAAQKGVRLLEREGITAGDIPPKILLPWLEGASLEAEADSALEDAWAGLFARAAKSSDAVILSYIEVLKRIGSKEAQLLWFFAGDTSPFFTQKFYDPRFIGGLNSPYTNVETAFQRLDEAKTLGELTDLLETFGLQAMCQVVYFSAGDSPTVPTKYYEDNEQTISNLEHLGLIKISSMSVSTKVRSYSLSWFEITKFAFDMFWACNGVITGKASMPDELKNKTNA